MRCEANDRQGVAQLARHITHPAISKEWLSVNQEGNVGLKLKPVLRLPKAPRGEKAQPTSYSRRWNSCSGWTRWRQGHGCI
ncbi:MAG: hypothetical protein ACKVQA_22335 [Burkholderiales bacterium]